MIWSLPLIALCIYTTAAEYTTMECVSDSSWLNNPEGSMTTSRSGYFLSGQESHHDNQHDDRQFKWDYCKPTAEYGDVFVGSETSLDQSIYQYEWTRECSGNAALTYAYSSHHNFYEDRVWTFKCQNLDESKFELTGCSWTDYGNGYISDVDYKCGSDGVLKGIGSQYHHFYKNRVWKFDCCRLEDVAAVSLTCIDDAEWSDNWEGSEATESSVPTHFVSGQYMGDKSKFKWKYCGSSEALFDSANIKDPVITSSISCEGHNNAVLVGDASTSGNYVHNKFKCATITSHTLDSAHCQTIKIVQLYNAEDNFECPNNGVMRTIERYVDGVSGHSTLEFMCCNLLSAASGNFVDLNSYNYGIKENIFYIIGGLNCLLLMVNIGVLIKAWCCKSSKTRYKVVSMQSTDDEV